MQGEKWTLTFTILESYSNYDPEVNMWKSLSEATCNLLPRLVHAQLSLPAFKVFVKCSSVKGRTVSQGQSQLILGMGTVILQPLTALMTLWAKKGSCQKDPELPLQAGKIAFPPQASCTVVKIMPVSRLQAERAELSAGTETDPIQRQM